MIQAIDKRRGTRDEGRGTRDEGRWAVLPIFEEELDILKPRQRPPFIEWLETRYMLKGGTAAIEGYWNREYTPYFVEPAEWLSDTTTREIWIYACSQGAKTTFGTGFVGYITDCMPGPTMLIMPTKPDVQNRVESRIRPMFAANEDLLRHVGGRVKNIYIGKQTVMDHMILYIGWPTTAQALADKPVCFIIADETGKYPPFVGEEADPINLMRKRQRWFKGRSKLLAMTTAVIEGDMSDQEWKRGDCCEFWVPCPHCQLWHQILWENVQIDRKPDKTWYSDGVYRKGKHARYVCPKCRVGWTEDDRWKAVSSGKWVQGDCELTDDGRLIGESKTTNYRSIRIHALMLHPMVETITGLVCEFVVAQRAKQAGNIQPLKDFWNNQLTRAWREERATTDIQILQGHIGSYPKGKVPSGVQMLTAGIDVQLDHVYFRVLGFGYLGEFWSIFEQRIETGATDKVENLEKLLPYLTMQFELMEESKTKMRIAISAIDRMYNTEAVDTFAVRCLGVVNLIVVAGDDKLQKQQWRVGKAAGGRLNRYDLNVTAFKDSLHRNYFESDEPGPGYGHLHAETSYIVLEHLTSEKKTIERKAGRIKWIGWVLKKTGMPNHYWDCDVYARAAAEIVGLWALPEKPKKAKADKTVKDKQDHKGFLDDLPKIME